MLQRFKVHFHVSIATAALVLVVLLTAATIASVWMSSSRAAREVASSLFAQVAAHSAERIGRELDSTLELAALGAVQNVAFPVRGAGLSHPALPFLIETLAARGGLYSLYVGHANGDFLQVIGARTDPRILAAHKAPEPTQWIVRTITGQGPARVQSWAFLDTARRVIGTATDPSPAYDPRARPWYKAAIGAPAAVLTPPYLFNSLKEPGITAARSLADGAGVFGVDITLTGLARFVADMSVSEHGGVLVFADDYRLLAASERLGLDLAPLADLRSVLRPLIQVATTALETGATRLLPTPDGDVLLHRTSLSHPGAALVIAVAAPFDDFTTHIRAMRMQILVLAVVALLLVLPLTVYAARRMGRKVAELAEDAIRVRNLDFSGSGIIGSHIVEFDQLGQAFGLMKTTLAAKTRALSTAQDKLARIVDLGIAMSAEHDSGKLMDMILLGSKELTNADGGTLYIRDFDANVLRFQILRNDTLGVAMGGEGAAAPNIPPVQLVDAEGRPNHKNVVSYAVHTQTTFNIADAYDSKEFDFSGTKAFDARSNYRSTSFLTVPLKPRGGEVIGALQLINARPAGSNEVTAFDEEIVRFVEALAAQAATALYNRDLLSAQEKLMDAMIKLVAGAIDAKSPYTGGHCARVPELSAMLAEEACKVTEGPLAEFAFTTQDEWREFRIGAWLHDCGKVVTPEYVVDKATKLETLYNRIHEVRTRFEVLLRDAEIALLKREITPEAFEERRASLAADFAFLAECNLGGEFMTPDRLARLNAIAATTWLRHFDDRLGLSHEEMRRLKDILPEPLPARETLLADKPQHKIPRDPGAERTYEELGFKVKVPENLYDIGEIYNLAVGRGTLVEEERFKIIEHVMQTIAMLEHLPFPRHMRRVPEYAGSHHETLNGTGYPRRLDAAQLSIPARITAIADIFEALTASDRPYKLPKTLSESVKILAMFKKDGHIDPVLFDLFLSSGVYRRYAEKFLKPEQIDDVDITAYLG